MNATSIAPPRPTLWSCFGRPLANVVIAPVRGSTRAMLPSVHWGIYSAPSGPMVLPSASPRPVASKVAGCPWAIFAASAVPLPRMIAQLNARPISNLFQFITFLHDTMHGCEMSGLCWAVFATHLLSDCARTLKGPHLPSSPPFRGLLVRIHDLLLDSRATSVSTPLGVGRMAFR